MNNHTTNEMIQLRDVTVSDLPHFFQHQLDPEANKMAAFTAKDPADREAFDANWAKRMKHETIMSKTILYAGQVAGNIVSFEYLGQPTIGYWLGKDYWGKGIATKAVDEFLRDLTVRPVYARVAKDNIASRRVLEKCGFRICGEDKGFANARGMEIEEYILIRDAE